MTPNEVRIEATQNGRCAFSLLDGSPAQIGQIEKMSKSKRNTVDPDEIIETYGADTARWFMLSDSPPDRDVIWSEEGVQGASRYVQQIWRLAVQLSQICQNASEADVSSKAALEIRRISHSHLQKVQENIERLRFNTAIAEIRKMTNALSMSLGSVSTPEELTQDVREAYREALHFLILMFAPMMPHLAEECWTFAGFEGLAAEAKWPTVNVLFATSQSLVLPVQVNGKKRAELEIEAEADNQTVEAEALKLEPIMRELAGRAPKKVIIVPKRIVNVVI
jgi:leucyl-tRNA synthetase